VELLIQALRIYDGICRTETMQLMVNKVGSGSKTVGPEFKYRKGEDALCPGALMDQGVDGEIENWNGGQYV
jgi:hypothetical protein